LAWPAQQRTQRGSDTDRRAPGRRDDDRQARCSRCGSARPAPHDATGTPATLRCDAHGLNPARTEVSVPARTERGIEPAGGDGTAVVLPAVRPNSGLVLPQAARRLGRVERPGEHRAAQASDLPDANRSFSDDTEHSTYDPGMVTRCWQVLSQVSLVLEEFAARCCGKASPCTTSGIPSTSRTPASPTALSTGPPTGWSTWGRTCLRCDAPVMPRPRVSWQGAAPDVRCLDSTLGPRVTAGAHRLVWVSRQVRGRRRCCAGAGSARPIRPRG
jgi:hypothetical protein